MLQNCNITESRLRCPSMKSEFKWSSFPESYATCQLRCCAAPVSARAVRLTAPYLFHLPQHQCFSRVMDPPQNTVCFFKPEVSTGQGSDSKWAGLWRCSKLRPTIRQDPLLPWHPLSKRAAAAGFCAKKNVTCKYRFFLTFFLRFSMPIVLGLVELTSLTWIALFFDILRLLPTLKPHLSSTASLKLTHTSARVEIVVKMSTLTAAEP